MPFIEPVQTQDPCPVCGAPMTNYVQHGLLPWHADIELAECRNPMCGLEMATLTRGAHQKLTQQQIDGYARARAARKASE